FPIPQLLNDPDAVRVPKDGKEGGELPGDQKSVRHGPSPFCYKIQSSELIVAERACARQIEVRARGKVAKYSHSISQVESHQDLAEEGSLRHGRQLAWRSDPSSCLGNALPASETSAIRAPKAAGVAVLDR